MEGSISKEHFLGLAPVSSSNVQCLTFVVDQNIQTSTIDSSISKEHCLDVPPIPSPIVERLTSVEDKISQSGMMECSICNARWFNLPLDLSKLIVERLAFIDDRNSFRHVCKGWGLVFEYNPKLLKSSGVPGLMLPFRERDHDANMQFYNITNKKTYTTRLPYIPAADHVVGSSPDGWMVYFDESVEIGALNMLTKETLRLPSVTALPGVVGRPNKFLIKRAVIVPYSSLIAPPIGEDRNVIFITYGYEDVVALASDGDESWTVLRSFNRISDLIVHKGLVYMAKKGDGEMFALNFTSLTRLGSYNKIANLQPRFYGQIYLVEIKGELWQVWRDSNYISAYDELIGYHSFRRMTTSVKLFKFDVRNNMWSKRTCIGDYVIFLGSNYSVARSTKEFPELEKDCIYFTDHSTKNEIVARYDMGIFNLRTRRFKLYCESDVHIPEIYLRASWVWIFPKALQL